jgi:hypothetical protein
MRDADVTPIVDADTVRRAIATAQDEVCGALRRVATRLGAGAIQLTVHERREARTLDELGLQASEMHAMQAASSDAQLLMRAGELKARADDIVRRVGELQAFAPGPPAYDIADEPHRAALADLLDAIDAADRELASAVPDDGPFRMPYAWVYDARLLSHGLGHYANLFEQLAGWIKRSQAAERAEAAHHALSLSDAEATALAVHLAVLRRRLSTAANAARLAARRCSLVELKELVLESPTTKLQIDDHEIAITLRETTPANGYTLRVDHAAYSEPFVLYSDGELVGAIAEAAGLDLSQLAQRRRAHRYAQLARRRLAAIVAYGASTRLGDPNDAADCGDPSAPTLPDDCRPDSRGDLTELLRDLADERWPIGATLKDSLTAVATQLGDGDPQRGISSMLAHPDEDPVHQALIRRLIST